MGCMGYSTQFLTVCGWVGFSAKPEKQRFSPSARMGRNGMEKNCLMPNPGVELEKSSGFRFHPMIQITCLNGIQATIGLCDYYQVILQST